MMTLLPVEIESVAIRAVGSAGTVDGSLAVAANTRAIRDVADDGNVVLHCERTFFQRAKYSREDGTGAGIIPH